MSKAERERQRARATQGGGLNSINGPRFILSDRHRLEMAVADGEQRLRSRVDSLGRRLTPGALAAIEQAVDRARSELAGLEAA